MPHQEVRKLTTHEVIHLDIDFDSGIRLLITEKDSLPVVQIRNSGRKVPGGKK